MRFNIIVKIRTLDYKEVRAVKENRKTRWVISLLASSALTAGLYLAGTTVPAQDQNANSQNSNTNANQNTNATGNANGNANTGAGRQGGTLGTADRRFLTAAAMSGMAEVELGQLAVQRGASDAVKQFGQRMVDDHTRANQELIGLASGAGVTLPTALDAKHRALVDRMSRLSGAAFDRAYKSQMVKDHTSAVALFQREAGRGAHADLKAFATRTLPTLQEHLGMAREMATGGTTPANRNANGNANSNLSGNANMNTNGNGNVNRNTNTNGNVNQNANSNPPAAH
jgi:putative membrane protein